MHSDEVFHHGKTELLSLDGWYTDDFRLTIDLGTRSDWLSSTMGYEIHHYLGVLVEGREVPSSFGYA